MLLSGYNIKWKAMFVLGSHEKFLALHFNKLPKFHSDTIFLRTVAPIANAHIFCALRIRPARSRDSCMCNGAKNFRCIELLFLYFASVVKVLTRKWGT